MLAPPSTSQRVRSTRMMSGSPPRSNSSRRSPTRAARRSLTVSTPATPPYSSTTTAKARRSRRMSASTSRTRRRLGHQDRAGGAGARCRAGTGLSGSTLADAVAAVDLPTGAEEVVHEEDADQVVEVVVVDGEAAVPDVRDRPGHVDGMDGDGETHHVDPRGHDLAHRRVAEVVQGGEDELLLVVGPDLLSPAATEAAIVEGGAPMTAFSATATRR